MAEIRYTGNAAWTRTVLDEHGKFQGTENVMPGGVIEVSESAARSLVRSHLPVEQRNFEFVESTPKEEPKVAPKAPSQAHPQARKA